MATNDYELIKEVRLLTEYDESIIPDGDMQSLVDLTQRELAADLGSTVPDFYSDLATERALFWLTCIFARVKTGEIEAPEFSIGELKVQRDSMGQQSSLWFNNFLKHYRGMAGGAPVGHIKSNRPDRDYRFEN